MKRTLTAFLLLMLCVALCACAEMGAPWEESTSRGNPIATAGRQEKLSDSCDYVLCSGTDRSGNDYELVANQTESVQGCEITVGVIKNNQWLCRPTADFPFLGEDGLFHVSTSLAEKSGSDLSSEGTIKSAISFMDSGAFLMECVTANGGLSLYDETTIIYSCKTQESITFNCDSGEDGAYELMYLRYDSGDIYTDDGQIVLSSVTRTSAYQDDWLYDWYILDTTTLELRQIAADVEDEYPRSILSEGLFFASDQCFYDTSMQKVIDLSDYEIDMSYDGGIYFRDGTCTFTAENDRGTEFLITIDTTGAVLREVQK